MSSGQSAERKARKRGALYRFRWILVGGLVLLMGGVVAGAGLWRSQNPVVEADRPNDAMRTSAGEALLPIGRITVNVTASGALSEKRTRYLVIEPTLLYEASFDQRQGEQAMPHFQAAMRDSFIEYLSQLHENDVHGSAGLADLRGELLRRARLVAQSDAPLSILLQDFVLQ